MIPFVQDVDFTLYVGDVREVLAEMPSDSVDCVVTSPPYWGLRDYGVEGQLGLEETPDEYVANLVAVFADVGRVLRPHGTCWLNLGDSYAAKARGSDAGWAKSRLTNPGTVQKAQAASLRQTGERHRGKRAGVKEKELVGIPWRVAFALQADGWYLRSEIIWAKPNPMPESVKDRPTRSHEQVFLLTRRPRYYFDTDAIAEPATWFGPNGKPKTGPHARQMHGRAGKQAAAAAAAANGDAPLTRNARSVWTILTQQYADAHFAVFPEELARRCILAGCAAGGTVLDPFMGSGTTALVARRLGRKSIGIELNPAYAEMCASRLGQQSLLAEGAA